MFCVYHFIDKAFIGYGFAQIMVNQLITEAVEAFRLGEVEELPTPPPTVEQLRNLMETEDEKRKVSPQTNPLPVTQTFQELINDPFRKQRFLISHQKGII